MTNYMELILSLFDTYSQICVVSHNSGLSIKQVQNISMSTQNGKCACACNDCIEILKLHDNKLLLHVILNHTKFGFFSKKEIS